MKRQIPLTIAWFRLSWLLQKSVMKSLSYASNRGCINRMLPERMMRSRIIPISKFTKERIEIRLTMDPIKRLLCQLSPSQQRLLQLMMCSLSAKSNRLCAKFSSTNNRLRISSCKVKTMNRTFRPGYLLNTSKLRGTKAIVNDFNLISTSQL